MTISEALSQAEAQLRSISDAPHLDAERLLLHVLQQTESSYLYTHPEQALTTTQERSWHAAITVRTKAMPLAYIIGTSEFYGRTFFVTPDVLIPRPDTEALVDAALTVLHTLPPPTTVADIGTGSGCIAITLILEANKVNIPLQVIATDISIDALAIAKKNAEYHGISDQISFRQGNLLTPLADTKIDLIVSNPPYLPAEALAKAGCAVETRGLLFEPPTALDGGTDGLYYVNQIKATGIPALVETVGGEIVMYNPVIHD